MLKLCVPPRLLQQPKRWLTTAAFIATLAGAHSANAQNAGRWYEIEMIFFNQGLGRIDQQELWPTHIQLGYPEVVNVLTETPEPLPETVPDTALNTEEETVEVEGIPRQTPFQRLGDEHKRLSELAKKIKTSGRHRVLAHWVWQQPVMGRKNADSILVFGGKQFDDHYELEGSIDLSVGRYLHLSTNLWLTRFTAFSDDIETFNPWPLLPERPLSTAQKEAQKGDLEDPTNLLENTENSAENIQQQEEEALILNALESLDATPADTSGNTDLTEFSASHFKRFQPERIALIQEKRRMRSATLHFIDHPLMGILIEIRRVNKE